MVVVFRVGVWAERGNMRPQPTAAVRIGEGGVPRVNTGNASSEKISDNNNVSTVYTTQTPTAHTLLVHTYTAVYCCGALTLCCSGGYQ